jgi:hypothetical protein
MSRESTAYLVIVLLIVGVAAIVVYSRRFARYERSRRFGHGEDKPVWKPFWLR